MQADSPPSPVASAPDACCDRTRPAAGGARLRRTLAATMALTAMVVPNAAAAGPAPGPPGENPSDRRWEVVSPQEKGDVDVGGDGYASSVKAAPDGDGVLYISAGVFPDTGAVGAALPNVYLAKRGASGWTTRSVSPPTDATWAVPGLGAGSTSWVLEPTEDLSKAVVATNVPMAAGAPPRVHNFYVHDHQDDSYQLLNDSGPSYTQVLSNAAAYFPHFQAATPDLRHVVFTGAHPYTDDAPDDGTVKIYEAVDGEVRLVSRLPNGDPIGGSSVYNTFGGGLWSKFHAISDDGRRVFFQVADGLFVRENGNVTREIPGGSGVNEFEAASADGSKLLHRSSDTGPHNGLHLYDLESEVDERIAEQAMVLAASEDLDYIYFLSPDELQPGLPPVGATNTRLWMWHEGQVSHVADIKDLDEGDPFENAGIGEFMVRADATASADGTRLVFVTTAQNVTAYDNQGTSQVYTYDALAGELECVSCPAGAPTGDAATWQAQSSVIINHQPQYARRIVSADAKRVFFQSPEPLVEQDTNGKLDVYVWEDGDVKLVSSGTEPFDARFVDATPDGEDVFFVTRGRLVGHDRDSLADLYVARAGGGFPEPEAAQPPCEGEACKGQPTPQPLRPGAGSQSFVGRGGPRPKRTAGCTSQRRKAMTLGKRAKALRAKVRRADGERAQQLGKQAKRTSAQAKRAKAKLNRCRRALSK